MIIISACLAGVPCRYNGTAAPDAECVELVAKGLAKTACSEVMGGLATPREPCEIEGGDGCDVLAGRARIVNAKGLDMTAEFVAGAEKFLDFLQLEGADMVYLKAKSPSCGVGVIYDGTFSGKTKAGDGVTAALLKQHGVKVANK